VELPGWLAPHVVREVTEEAEYQNFELAIRLGRNHGPWAATLVLESPAREPGHDGLSALRSLGGLPP
jgi:hypothetical protein